MSSLNAITLKLQAEGGPRRIAASEVRAELVRGAGDAVGTRAMLVLDATGTVVASVGVPETQEGLSVRQRPAMAYHLAHPTDLGIQVAHAHYSELTGGWVLPLSRIVPSRDGKMLGVVLVGIDLSYMRNLYEQMGNLRDANFLIVGRGTGGIVFRQPFIDGSIGFLPVGNPPIFEGAGTYEATSQLDGITRIISYRQLRDVDAVMLVGYPREEVLAGWRNFARERVTWTVTSLSLFALICCAGWLGYRRYGRQLRALEQGFKIREGELRQEADNKTSRSPYLKACRRRSASCAVFWRPTPRRRPRCARRCARTSSCPPSRWRDWLRTFGLWRLPVIQPSSGRTLT